MKIFYRKISSINKTIFVLVLLIVSCISINGQTDILVPEQILGSPSKIEQLGVCLFTIVNQNDTIQFIKTGTDLEIPKPTIIYLQGSLPKPMIIRMNEKWLHLTIPFDYKKFSEEYNIIIISMPFVPAILPYSQLNDQFAYITDTSNEHSFPIQYQEANHLDKYVERGEAVIRFLKKQNWVDEKRFVLLGHSQGAIVGTKIAVKNEHVAALGYFSGNPLGRITSYVQEIRWAEQKGTIGAEEAKKQIDEMYSWWEWMIANPDLIPAKGGDWNKATISFSVPHVNDLINMSPPVYVAYGSIDIGSSTYCDFLPIDFIRAGKKNYKVVPYVNCEHNFMKLDSTGNPDESEIYWDKAVEDFIEWLENESGVFKK